MPVRVLSGVDLRLALCRVAKPTTLVGRETHLFRLFSRWSGRVAPQETQTKGEEFGAVYHHYGMPRWSLGIQMPVSHRATTALFLSNTSRCTKRKLRTKGKSNVNMNHCVCVASVTSPWAALLGAVRGRIAGVVQVERMLRTRRAYQGVISAPLKLVWERKYLQEHCPLPNREASMIHAHCAKAGQRPKHDLRSRELSFFFLWFTARLALQSGCVLASKISNHRRSSKDGRDNGSMCN